MGLRVMEAGAHGSPKDALAAMQWSIALEKIDTVLDKAAPPDATIRDQLQTLMLKTEEKSVPFVHELTRGKHTLDVQVVETVEASEDADGDD